MSGKPLKPSHASARKGKNSYLVELNDGLVVRVKKMDPIQMIFEGHLTLPMLRAAQRFEDIQDQLNSSDQDAKNKAAEEFLAGEEKDSFLKMLREYAVLHVMEPTLTLEEDGNENHLCVKELQFSELLAIFNSAPTRNEELAGMAEEFRRAESTADGDAPSAGKELRGETELVAVSPERDTISG